MREVVVATKDLLEKLKENRDIHANEYNEMLEVYQNKVIEGLSKLLEEAKKKPDEPVTHLNLPKPVSYVNEYDTVIGMIRMSSEFNIAITQDEYKKYVLNEWNWTNIFNSLKANYVG